MRTIRPAIALLALIVITTFIGACAGSAASLAPVGAPVEAPASEGGGSEPGRANGGQAVIDDGTVGGGDGVGAPVDDARIIRTGTIDLEVGDVGVALTRARDGIRALGGYIGASSTQNDGDRPIASITYRVPADRWEDALDLLRGIDGAGTTVVAEHTEAVEVTGAVIDLEARIRNLRASEAALQEIAAKAVRIPDVLEVQNQLTQVRGQIEQLTAQLADLEGRAAFATLTASYRLPIVAVEIAKQEWDRPRRRRGECEPGQRPAGPHERRHLVRHRVAADHPRGRRHRRAGRGDHAPDGRHRPAPAQGSRSRRRLTRDRSVARGTIHG